MGKVESDIPSCKKLFGMELFVMRCIGLGSLEHAFEINDNNIKPNVKAWELTFFIATVCLISTLLYSLYTSIPYYLGKDFSLTCFILSVSFSMSMTFMKFLRLWSSRIKFYQLLKIVNTIWEKHIRKRTDLKAEIIKIIDDNKTVRLLYAVIALILNVCYSLRPFIITITNYITLSENETMTYTEQAYTGVVYPIRSDTFARYLFLIILEFQASYFASIYLILSELLFIFLTTMLTAEFMVLANEYFCLFDIYQDNNKNLTIINEIIQRHCLLLVACQQITYLFSPIIMSTIIFNGIDLCCSIFALQQEFAAGRGEISLLKNLPHASILIFQIMIYCNCAHVTTERIESLREAIYGSSWINGDKKLIKYVIVIMINSQKEFNFTAYGLFNLNRQQLTQIFNTTTSYFMLLRNFA